MFVGSPTEADHGEGRAELEPQITLVRLNIAEGVPPCPEQGGGKPQALHGQEMHFSDPVAEAQLPSAETRFHLHHESPETAVSSSLVEG